MTSDPKRKAELLVVDLDNTLWDWFHAWYASFTALLDGVVAVTGFERQRLEREIRPIHQKYVTSEYSPLLEELESLRPFLGGKKVRDVFDEALHAQNSARKQETTLYPGVLETLETIKARGTPVIAYTEAIAFWTEWRLKLLGLDGAIDVLYSAPDHDFPLGSGPEVMRTLPESEYGLKRTEHLHVPRGVLKPDPRILRGILNEQHIDPARAVYVGDSLSKDVAMAQAVGVIDVYAKYGVVKNSEEYQQLVRVSHWPDAAIDKELSTKRGANPSPTYVLSEGFFELLDHFEFGKRT